MRLSPYLAHPKRRPCRARFSVSKRPALSPRRLRVACRQLCRATFRRRSLAWLACALWVLSLEAIPNFHIGFHDLLPHHHHGHSETKHSHADHGDDQPDHSDDRPDHGANSFEHRGVAILGAPPPIVIVAITSFKFVAKLEQVDEPIALRQPQSIRVRGPPLLS